MLFFSFLLGAVLLIIGVLIRANAREKHSRILGIALAIGGVSIFLSGIVLSLWFFK